MAFFTIDPVQFCRTFFVTITLGGLGACALPSCARLVSYGPRTLPTSATSVPSPETKDEKATVLDKLAKLQVPHTWFTHFYMVSVASSVVWAYQLAMKGALFNLLTSRYASGEHAGMTVNQVLITMTLMAIQGSRRLYESITLLKPSTAQMPLTSYALGVAFYLVVGVAVWAEGIPNLISSNYSSKNLAFSRPSYKTIIGVPLFFATSAFQHDSHVYLASLKKYTLPDRRLFRWIICPHYTSECVIYIALAIVGAPQGQLLNMTISTVLLFTAANLTITSNSTKAWYIRKFGDESVKGRSRMIPYIY